MKDSVAWSELSEGCSAYEVERYQIFCLNDERTQREPRAEGR